MAKDLVLRRVAMTHAVLLAVLGLVLQSFGWPLKGALLGGGLAGFSFVTFWVVARSITEPRRKGLAVLLGGLKIALYLSVSAAVLSGRLVADASGFALGISCFVAAVLIAALGWRVAHPPTLEAAKGS